MNEVDTWKSIAGLEGAYEISPFGSVASLPRKGRPRRRMLKPWLDTAGRPMVTLYLRGKQTHLLVSHLVADAFLLPKGPTDQVLRHLNDNPADNRIENLAWGTYSDNQRDAICNGKHRASKGIANGMAKLTEDDVRGIRRLYETENFLMRELALRFGVATGTVCQIISQRAWRHVV